MTQPTGVFVRLPLSEAAREILVDAAAFGKPDDSHDQAVLSIGTPVTGSDLYPVGYIAEDAIGGLATGIYQSASIFRDADKEHHDTVALVRFESAQAAIAALEAEVGRLRGIVNTLSSKIAECGSEGYDLSGSDCVDLLNDAGLIEWGTFDPEVHEAWIFDGCEAGDPIWTLKGPEA